jgi:MFS transporter, DHA1 family, staphyloferrin A biosynthesis exporter
MVKDTGEKGIPRHGDQPGHSIWGRTLRRLRRISTFDSLSSKSFRFFLCSMFGQSSAQSIQMVTNPLLAYRLTGSAVILGVISLVSALPSVIVSLFGGVVADRMPKKYLLQISQGAMALSSLAIGLTLATGYMSSAHPGSWWVLMANSIFQGIANAFAMPASQAIIPEMVRKEQVMNAVSLNNMGSNIARLIAPVAAGFVIDAFGFESVFYIMAALYAIAIGFVFFMPRTKAPARSGHNALVDIVEGFSYVRSQRTIMLLFVIATAFILTFMPIQNMLAVFTDSVLQVGASGLGLLMSVSGAGALAATLLTASLPGKKRGVIHLTATFVLGLATIGFAISRIWPLSITLMVIMGIAQMGHITTGNTLLQTSSEPRYLGRVMSILMMNSGLAAVCTFLAGVLINQYGAAWTIGGFGLFLALVTGLALIFMPRVRRLD